MKQWFAASAVAAMILAIAGVARVEAQNGPARIASVARLNREIAGMASRDWQVRSEHFFRLRDLIAPDANHPQSFAISKNERAFSAPALSQLDPAMAVRVRGALVRSLHAESELLRSGGELPEEYGVYHGELLHAVALLRDPSTIPLLVENLPWGNSAAEALVGIGAPAVGPLIATVRKHPDGLYRAIAIDTLAAVLTSQTLDAKTNAAELRSIETLAVSLVTDADDMIRVADVGLLDALNDSEATLAIAGLAANDPSCDIEPETGQTVCNVRNVANAVLQRKSKQQ